MKRKILIILFSIIMIGVCAFAVYQKYYVKEVSQATQKKAVSIDDIKETPPEQTGGIVDEQSQNEVKEGLSVNDLIKSLPYSTTGFTISEYDYADGTFIIDAKYSPEMQKVFDDWYETSSYKSVPKELFTFKATESP